MSVLIVNWNTRALLESCLASLATAEPDGFLEIIVVDNGSTDGSAELAGGDPGVELIANDHNLGFAAAVNQADAVASAPLRLLLNSDTVVGPGVIRGCVDYLHGHPEVGALGCRLTNEDGTHQVSAYRFPSLRNVALDATYLSQAFPRSPLFNGAKYGAQDWDDVHQADAVMGSFFLVRRDAVPAGEALLDEGYFMYCEEVDLCRRLADAGRRVVVHPGFEIQHVRGASSAKSPELVGWAESAKRRGQLRFLRRWRPPWVAWLANAMMLLGLAPRWCIWAGSDLLDRLRGRPDPRRRLRAGVGRFHARALLQPSALEEAWGAPPSSRLAGAAVDAGVTEVQPKT